MNKKYFLLSDKTRIIVLLLAFSQLFGQKLEPIDIGLMQVREIVEVASRSSQKVFVEDFTGLL